jgi:hypothetical protein
LVGDRLPLCDSFAAPERFDRLADKSRREGQSGADVPIRSNVNSMTPIRERRTMLSET